MLRALTYFDRDGSYLNRPAERKEGKMINAKHSEGKVVVSTDDSDNMGEPIRTDRHVDLESAMRLYAELGEAITECRRFVVMKVL